MRRLDFLWGGLLAVVLGACGNGTDSKEDTCPVVRLDTVATVGEFTVLQFPGRVKSAQSVNLSFKVPGTLQHLYVDEGAQVRKGQLLAELDDTDYRVQLSATKAEYEQVKADAERVMALFKENGTTASANDRARYGLQQIQAKLANHENQLAYTRMYAPFTGQVQQRFFDGKETVGAGMPVFTILDTTDPEIEINLPASSYVRRDEFSAYTCTFDVLPGRLLRLEPISILPKANANQLYTMRLRLKESNGITRPAPGMSAWVTIHLEADSLSGLVKVPSGALLEEGGKSYVFIYDTGKQTVRRMPVRLKRLLSDGKVLVTGDIRRGSLVVASGVHNIKDGSKVNPLPRQSETNIGGLL